MTKTEVNNFRKLLEDKQTELGHGSKKREALTIEASPDELDRIQNANDRDCAMIGLQRDSIRLREVRAALLRMDAGNFGICDACEEDIHPKRLAAVPWASLCIGCQESADREQAAGDREMEDPLLAAA